MTARISLLIVAASAVATASPASAQTAPATPSVPVPSARPSTSIPPRISPLPRSSSSRAYGDGLIYATARPLAASDQYLRVMDYARCAAKVSPDLSARLLSADPASGQAIALSRQLRGISKGCLPAGAFVSTTFFRGALAESLYRRTGTTPAAAARPASVTTIAECVFVQSPASVDRLLRTEPGSKAERGVLDTLAPLTQHCIVNGQRVNIAGLDAYLRSGLAEIAYHSATSAPPRS